MLRLWVRVPSVALMEEKICRLCLERPTKGNRIHCNHCSVKLRRFRIKLAAIHLLGGKCEICGWSGHFSGFDFHHKNPSEKDFAISKCGTISWEKIKKEVLKCQLLCCLCHRKIHNSCTPRFMEAVLNYKGGLDLYEEIGEL